MASPGPSFQPSCTASDAVEPPGIEAIGAITLSTRDMARAVRFYRTLGFALHHGGEDAPFSCLRAGAVHLNLTTEGADRQGAWWGRLVVRVRDVDAFHSALLARGVRPAFGPRDAPWRERYFHVTDPDGHELSFMHPIGP